jgi:small ubiquitin-related modifier
LIRFLFDGERIQPNSTPAQLEMEDEDEIDAMVEQHGGNAMEIDN